MSQIDEFEIERLARRVERAPWSAKRIDGTPVKYHVVGPDGVTPLLAAKKQEVADYAAAMCSLGHDLGPFVRELRAERDGALRARDTAEEELKGIREESGFEEADRERRKYRDAIDDAIATLKGGDGPLPMLSLAALRGLETAVEGKPTTGPAETDEPVAPMQVKSAQAVVARFSAGAVAIWRKLVELPDATPWLDVEKGTNGQKAADKLVSLGYVVLCGPAEVDGRHGMATYRLNALGRAVRDAKATVTTLAAAAAEGGA